MTENLIKIEELHKSFGKMKFKGNLDISNVEKLWSSVRCSSGNQLSFVR